MKRLQIAKHLNFRTRENDVPNPPPAQEDLPRSAPSAPSVPGPVGEGELGEPGELSWRLEDNYDVLTAKWQNCADVFFRRLTAGGTELLLVWVHTLVGKEMAQDGIVEPLTQTQKGLTSIDDLGQVLTAVQTVKLKTFVQVMQAIADGSLILFMDGVNEAMSVDVSGLQGRPIQKPELEPGVLGPQEAFTESLDKNLGLMRRRLKSPEMKIKSLRLGTISSSQLSVLYVDGIVKPQLVQEVEARLAKIQVDGLLDINYISEFTRDAIRSPYPTDQVTERPDRTAAALLQGRVAILLDGSPYAQLIPALFVHFLNSSEDYYGSYTLSLPVRLLRHFVFWMSLLLPSLYIALLSYHQEMIPTALLIRLAATHEGIPFPAVVEAFIMVTTFEALREAGIRLPKAVGQSVSIVGALVIGDAAVNAGIVSPGMVIAVALTGVASFAIPSYSIALTNRILQYPFMVLAGMFGLYGMTIGLILLLTHLVSLRSYGTPYLYPLAPWDWQAIRQDVFARSAWWDMKKRAKGLETVSKTRGQTAKPQPTGGGSSG